VPSLTSNRMAALGGIAFIVLILVAALSSGSPPDVNDSAAKIARYFADHHKRLAVGAVLSGIAAPFYVWLFSVVCRGMRKAGAVALSVGAFGFVVVGAALAVTGDAINASLAHAASQGDAAFTKSGYDLSGFMSQKFWWFSAFLAFAIWLASTSTAQWYRWLTFVATILFVLGGIGVMQHGFFAVDGPATFIAFVAFLVWVLGTSVVVWLTPEEVS
jgi:hypothetical protein